MEEHIVMKEFSSLGLFLAAIALLGFLGLGEFFARFFRAVGGFFVESFRFARVQGRRFFRTSFFRTSDRGLRHGFGRLGFALGAFALLVAVAPVVFPPVSSSFTTLFNNFGFGS
jgi:hypothetical protein